MNIPNQKLKAFMDFYHTIVLKDEFNLFDVANIKEFRHSEILYRLLSYSVHGRCTFLESFLRRLDIKTETWSFSDVDVHVSREEHIDGRPIDVVAVGGQSALIIENKCCNASDMPQQLRDYIENVKTKHAICEENLTCLYLRRIDSLEEPNKISTVDDHHANLVTISSYRELVVPWLKNDVLKNLPYGSGIMTASLVAYIDMLESWSGERGRTAENGRNAVKLFEKVYNCTSPETYKICCDELGRTRSIVNDDLVRAEVDSALNLIKTTLWESNPLLDSFELAEQLKWMLKNNPYPFGRTSMQSKVDTGSIFDYSSIGRWYDVVKAERSVVAPDGTATAVRIHFNCGNLHSLNQESEIVYGGVCKPIVNLPAYDKIVAGLHEKGFEITGKPEEGVGFFFTASERILQTFNCTRADSGREIIWKLANRFSWCVKTYSDVLCSAGYKPA